MNNDEEKRRELYRQATRKYLEVYRVLRRYSKTIQEAGISGRQIACLRFLLEHGASTIGEVAKYLFITQGSASELVDKLEKTGLAERERSKDDNRKVFVMLTVHGNVQAETLPLGGMPLLRERLSTLDARSLRGIERSFTKIMEIMEIPDEEG